MEQNIKTALLFNNIDYDVWKQYLNRFLQSLEVKDTSANSLKDFLQLLLNASVIINTKYEQEEYEIIIKLLSALVAKKTLDEKKDASKIDIEYQNGKLRPEYFLTDALKKDMLYNNDIIEDSNPRR